MYIKRTITIKQMVAANTQMDTVIEKYIPYSAVEASLTSPP